MLLDFTSKLSPIYVNLAVLHGVGFEVVLSRGMGNPRIATSVVVSFSKCCVIAVCFGGLDCSSKPNHQETFPSCSTGPFLSLPKCSHSGLEPR